MNRRKHLALACMALAVGLMGGRVEGAFDPTGWSRCMPITFTNDVRLNTLTNFPALVVLDTNKVTYSQQGRGVVSGHRVALKKSADNADSRP